MATIFGRMEGITSLFLLPYIFVPLDLVDICLVINTVLLIYFTACFTSAPTCSSSPSFHFAVHFGAPTLKLMMLNATLVISDTTVDKDFRVKCSRA